MTNLAFPLIAIIILHASASQMGLQNTFWATGAVLAALFAGPLVDRLPRQHIMIGANIGRGLIVTALPLAAITGRLGMEHIYLAALLFSVLTVAYDIANISFLPALVSGKHLVEGNSALQASSSVIGVAGPGLAGVVIQAIGAPIAMLIDAVSYFFSVFLVGSIAPPTPVASRDRQRQALWKQIGAGFGLVLSNPILRALAATSGTFVFFLQFFSALRFLYLTRDLGLAPAAIGIISAAGSTGGVLGAMRATRIVQRLGMGRTLLITLVLSGIGNFLIPLAVGEPLMVLVILLLGALLDGLGGSVYNIGALSLRQAITREEVQGRVNATMRFFAIGVTPLGALLSGVLAEQFGVRTVLLAAGVGEILSCLWLLYSPLLATSTPDLADH